MSIEVPHNHEGLQKQPDVPRHRIAWLSGMARRITAAGINCCTPVVVRDILHPGLEADILSQYEHALALDRAKTPEDIEREIAMDYAGVHPWLQTFLLNARLANVPTMAEEDRQWRIMKGILDMHFSSFIRDLDGSERNELITYLLSLPLPASAG